VDNKQLWDSALIEIELNISKANFKTWFKETFISKQEDGVVYISVPSEFVKGWLYDKFHRLILKTLRLTRGEVRSIEYIVSKDRPLNQKMINDVSSLGKIELPLDNFYVNKKDNLNPRYDFNSFVVGPFNELAHAASQAVIKNPGGAYNPLFIYGPTGVGKTHLMQAIGNKIKDLYQNKEIYYLTSEKFAVDYTNSIQANTMGSFKERYRKYKVIVMDDIQFFSDKEKTQEELFHLFNTLYENGAQIVFSSDRHPNFIPGLEDRLKSRFAQGMIVDISTPDYESRSAIIKKKSSQSNFLIPEEIVDYLATSVEGSIRELEGLLNSIICQAQLKNKTPNLNDIKGLIKNSVKPKKMVPVENIIKTVANYYNIEPESIYKKTRKKEIVKPRQLIMYLLREDYNMPYPTIGQKLGGRDHTTVIHSYEKIKRELKDEAILDREVEQLRSML
jgi:chromosomal replication initiator protein